MSAELESGGTEVNIQFDRKCSFPVSAKHAEHFGMETLFMRGQYEYADALGLSPSYSKAACNGPQEKL